MSGACRSCPRELERSADPARIAQIDARGRFGIASAQLVDGPGQISGDMILDRSADVGRHLPGEVERCQRGANVEARSSCNDRDTGAFEDVVDRRMRSGCEVGNRGALGQVEVTDEVIGDRGTLDRGGRVGSDLEAAVALEGVGDDDLAIERQSCCVGERALPRCRRSEQRKDTISTQELAPRSAVRRGSRTLSP